MKRIPRHEPEVTRATAARHWRGDHEKVATTSMKSITVDGVHIKSRYQKAHEFELMRSLILDLPACFRNSVTSIFCDSKAECVFELVLRDWDPYCAEIIGNAVAAAAMDRNGGYNGIYVRGPGKPMILTRIGATMSLIGRWRLRTQA
jgi:hypothetical protein